MGLFTNLPAAIGRRWNDRAAYGSTGSWLLSVYDRALKRAPGAPFPGRKSVRRVRVKGFDWPLFARLGSSDFLVIEELFWRREYDFLFDGRLGRVATVLDLGANCGYSMLLWLRHFPEARLVAVEPDPNNIAVLKRNVSAHDPHGLATIVEACAAGTSRSVYLDRASEEWMFSFSDRPSPTSLEVPALTVPQIVDRAGLGDAPLDLVKCDIEGAERELFADASAWLPRVRNLLVEVHHPVVGDDIRRAAEAVWGRTTCEAVSPPGPQQLYFLTRA